MKLASFRKLLAFLNCRIFINITILWLGNSLIEIHYFVCVCAWVKFVPSDQKKVGGLVVAQTNIAFFFNLETEKKGQSARVRAFFLTIEDIKLCLYMEYWIYLKAESNRIAMIFLEKINKPNPPLIRFCSREWGRRYRPRPATTTIRSPSLVRCCLFLLSLVV